MRIADILRHNIAWLSLHFLLLADYFDASTARGRTWLHDVHVPVVISFSIHAKLAIVVREEIGPRAEIELLKYALHPTNILPHHVLPAHLKRLREVIQFLILCCLFEVFRFGLACPLHVPFRAVRANDSKASCL